MRGGQLLGWQREAAERGQRQNLCLFAETGTGKTIAGLELIDRLPAPALVVCPLSIIEPAWRRDAARFYPHLRVVSLWAPTVRKRLQALKRPADVYLLNYDGLRILWQRHRRALLERGFRTVILDESSVIRNPRAAVTKAALAFAQHIPRRFVMSGSPAPNGAWEFWPQVSFVRPGVLGRSFWTFRASWFYPRRKDPRNPSVVWEWGIKPQRLERLMAIIRRHAVFVRKADCLDLPPQVDEVRYVLLPPPQRRAYDEMLNALVVQLGDSLDETALAVNRLAQIMKLRQITAGLLVTTDGQHRWCWDTKLKALGEVLDELGDAPAIVWVQFQEEAQRAIEFLERRARGLVGELTGRTPPSERGEIVRRFQSGDLRYLVGHPGAARFGLTLTAARYAIYVSLGYGAEEWQQSRDRIHRHGQTRSCTYLYLIAPGTIDETIYETLRRKGDIALATLEYLRRARESSPAQ